MSIQDQLRALRDWEAFSLPQNIIVTPEYKDIGDANYVPTGKYKIIEPGRGDEEDSRVISIVGKDAITQGQDSEGYATYGLNREKYKELTLGTKPVVNGVSNYSQALKTALDQGVDLKPLYGETYADAVKFKQDLGQYAGKDQSMIIPANPVGYKGEFKFDPNFGSSYYRDLAMQSGEALGLSPQEIIKQGTDYFSEKFYSGAQTKGVIGFTDFGGGLLDKLAVGAGLPADRLEELKGTVLKPLYDVNKEIFSNLNSAARVESQSSGFFKGIGQSLSSLPGIIQAGLNFATGGLFGVGTAVLQGDIKGALKAAALNQIGAKVGGAAGDFAGSQGLSSAVQEGIKSGVQQGIVTGDIKQALTSGLLGSGLSGNIGGQVSEAIGGGTGATIGAGVDKGLNYLFRDKDALEGFLRGAGREGLGQFGQFVNDLDLELPKFDFNLPSTGGLGFKLPEGFDFNFPKFDVNLPDLNFPDFNNPLDGIDVGDFFKGIEFPDGFKFNFEGVNTNTNLNNVFDNLKGNSNMDMNSVLSGLFSSQGLSALLSGLGTEQQIDKLRELGQQGQSLFSGIANQAGQNTGFKPYNFTSSIGSSVVDPVTGKITTSLSPQQQQFTNAAMGAAQGQLTPFSNQQLTDLTNQSLGMAGSTLQRAGQGDPDLDRLRTMYGDKALGMAGMLGGSTDEQAQKLFDLRQQIAAPQTERTRLELENRLRAQGRLGQTTAAFGGTGEQLALEKALAEQRSSDTLSSILNAEQLAGAQQARALGLGDATAGMASNIEQLRNTRLGQAQGLFGMGLQGIQLPEQLTAQRFQNAGALQGMGLAPQNLLNQQAQMGAGLSQAQATQQLNVNRLIAELQGQGGLLPLQAEGQASGLRAAQLQALAQALGGQGGGGSGGSTMVQNPLGGAVNQIGSAIGGGISSGLNSLFGGISSLFGGGSSSPMDQYTGGLDNADFDLFNILGSTGTSPYSLSTGTSPVGIRFDTADIAKYFG